MPRILFAFALPLFGLAFLLVGCNAISSSPEPVARTAAEQFLQKQGIPYKDVSLQTLKNDGTYATVRVIAWLRPSVQSDWVEQYTDIEVRNVGGQWQTAPYMVFQLSEREQKKIQDQQNATATAWAQQRATAEAAATASANATRQAEIRLVQSIRVLTVDNVEYPFEPTSCPGGIEGCKNWKGRRITFSIENLDIATHSVKVELTIVDYETTGLSTGYLQRKDYKQTAFWEGSITPGRNSITFVAERTGDWGWQGAQMHFVSGSYKILSVDKVMVR